jgi:subtilisin family serine protease
VHGHGTHVSGTITSAGVVAPVGVAPDADILAVQVIGPDGSGWISDFTAGIDYVVSVMDDYDDLCAINMSLGSFELFAECPANDATTYNAAMQAALLAAWVGGSATFASSGNNGECGSMTSPACLSSAVAVAAVYDLDLGTEPDVGTYADEFGFPFGDCSDTTTGPDEVTCFTNRSECNELAAPGRDINSSCIGGGQCANTGTSMASPHCAGVAALLCEETPTITPGQIVDLLKTTGVATSDPCAGFPNPIRIDAKAAIDAVVPTLSTSGLGLGGSGGVPVLTGVSTLLTGDPIELVMQKALENSTSTLVVGVSALFASFKGGTLVPHPDLLLIGLPVDGSGRLVLQGTWPPGIPSGTGIWFQHWVTDQAGPAGFSASNGLGGTVP